MTAIERRWRSVVEDADQAGLVMRNLALDLREKGFADQAQRIEEWAGVLGHTRDALAALVEEAKALGELQDACIKRYCGMTGPDEWREAVLKSPEGQRLIAIAATQSEQGEGDEQ